MFLKRVLAAVGVLACVGAAVCGDEQKTKPRKWDQEKAVKKVKAVLALEDAEDFAWNKIPWITDVNQAVALAKEQRKPIFLYFFLKGNNGPAKAPC